MGAEARLNSRMNWHRVTNEFVASLGSLDCETCNGDGYHSEPRVVCECARAEFRKQYVGRVRFRNEGGKTWMEYRDLVAVPA